MEIKSEKYKFTLPDRPTVRQQLEYYSASAGSASLVRYWNGAKTLIQSWECESFPDFTVDIESVTDPSITAVIIEAGLDVMRYINALEDVPKN
jgi:hypothetical protein